MRMWTKAVAAACLAGLLMSGLGSGVVQAADTVGNTTVVSTVYDRVRPSVASVVVTRDERVEVGSGVYYRSSYLITAASLVSGAKRIRVLNDRGQVEEVADLARNVWTDDATNIAVIKVKPGGVTSITVRNGGQINQGDAAFLIARPFGYMSGATVNRGMVSGTWRHHVAGVQRASWGLDFPMLQTDAVFNIGSEGGALVDSNGDLVGIAMGKLRVAGIERSAYALPVEIVKQVADELINNGTVSRPWLGLYAEESEAAASGLPADHGLTVLAVPAGTAADGKVHVGDRVLKIGDVPLRTVDDYTTAMGALKPGDSVTLSLRRGAQTLDVTIEAALRPKSAILPSDSQAWFSLTRLQISRALDYTESLGEKPALHDLTAGYAVSNTNGQALLVTEFAQLALAQWRSSGQRLSINASCERAGAVRGTLEVYVSLAPEKNDKYTAQLVQGSQAVSGRQTAVDADLTTLFGNANGKQTYAFTFASAALSPDMPVTLVVKSAETTVAMFRWDLSKVR